MTEHDNKLIEEAERIPDWCWDQIDTLSQMADTDEAKRILYDMATAAYHRDECRYDYC